MLVPSSRWTRATAGHQTGRFAAMEPTMPVSVSFFGAARTVTGSCLLLTTGRATILVDCGMLQGSRPEIGIHRVKA